MAFAIKDTTKRWADGVVPFEIDTLAFPIGSVERKELDAAIWMWNTRTCFRFLQKSPSHASWIRFVAATSARSSLVGRQGVPQDVACDLASSGFGTGSIIHEILHALGFFHEQQRPDRDSFVEILTINIVAGKASNFSIKMGELPIRDYDCGSIMHYPRDAFGITDPVTGVKALTIRVLDNSRCPAIGQIQGLSSSDLTAIHEIHSLPLKAAMPLVHVAELTNPANSSIEEESEFRPALAVHGDKLFLAWTGTDDRLNVVLSGDATRFQTKHTSSLESESGPTLASQFGRLFISWIDNAGRINIGRIVVGATTAGDEFVDRIELLSTLLETSDSPPSLTACEEVLLLSWTGTDGHLNFLLSHDGVDWFGKHTSAETSDGGPCVVGLEKEAFVSWKGTDEALNVAAIFFRRVNRIESVEILANKITLDETSDSSPVVARFDSSMFLGWRGQHDEEINLRSGCGRLNFYATLDFPGAKLVSSEKSSDAIALVEFHDQFVVAWTDDDTLKTAIMF